MSVSLAPEAAARWQPIGEIVAELRTECSDLEQLVQTLFDQLDQLRGELHRKAIELQQQRRLLAERERQLAEQRTETSRIAHQFEHQEAKLSEALTELAELKTLVAGRPAIEGGVPAGLNELLQEKAGLEAELEMVRGKAAELYDTLAHERRALAEERAETSGELKQLRRIVERQAELLGERPAAAPPANVTQEVHLDELADEVEELAGTASDPVVSSVMAQFARLQKEVAERRKQRKGK